MSKVPPFHSVSSSAPWAYHDNTECTQGRGIKMSTLVLGTGNRPACLACLNLSIKTRCKMVFLDARSKKRALDITEYHC
ncbi:MAG: hypothetical protein V4443_00475 [Pseudomonadota bacterium]